MVNPTGYTALDMIGFTDQGAYSSSDNYVKNDLVHYSGNIWRCLIDDTSGIAPAEGVNWTLFIGEPTNLVERIIAPVETDPATSAWAVGRQIIFNDNLYEVITAITAGDALVTYEDDPTNANIKLADPVETQLLNEEAARAAADLALQNALSHRNLLDNPWFTINQRGIDSTTETWTQFKTGVDRWSNFSSTRKLILTDDGVSELDGKSVTVYQIFDAENDIEIINIYGKVVTISILYADGTIDSGTATVPLNYLRPQSHQDVRFITNTAHTSFAQIESYAKRTNVVFEAKAGNTIRAVKLELGSVSTLAMDTAPNYAEELLKCQRYFQRIKIKANYAMLGLARAVSATSAQSFITPSVPLRAFPSLTVGNISSLSFFANSTSYSISNIVMGTGLYNDSDVVGFQLQFTSSGLTTDDLLSFAGNNAVGSNIPYLDFSADL